jgi:hypothetical protein
MTSNLLRRAAVVAALAAAFLAIPRARAESRAEEDVTPLGLVRHAALVAVVEGQAPAAGSEALGSLRVEEVLRGGPAKQGDVVEVRGDPRREDLRVLPGTRSLGFFVRGADGRWEIYAGALGLVALEDAAAGDGATLSLFRTLSGEIGPEGRIAVPDVARAALVRAATAVGGRNGSGAALDLVREPGLLAGATEADRAALVAAFSSAAPASREKGHLARVVGMLRPEGAGRILVDALLGDGGGLLRSAVGRALGDLGDPEALSLLASRTATASPDLRGRAATALGWSGMPAARAPLEALLGAAEPAVRFEAAIGVGRLGLADSAPALLRRFRGDGAGGPAAEGDREVRKALVWALARCDDPAAWRSLEESARADADETFRGYVADVLRNPRREFVR